MQGNIMATTNFYRALKQAQITDPTRRTVLFVISKLNYKNQLLQGIGQKKQEFSTRKSDEYFIRGGTICFVSKVQNVLFNNSNCLTETEIKKVYAETSDRELQQQLQDLRRVYTPLQNKAITIVHLCNLG